MAHNLARWTTRIGLGEPVVTTKTLRRRFLSLAGRLTRKARRLTLHLPHRWPWQNQFSSALAPTARPATSFLTPPTGLTRPPGYSNASPTRARPCSECLLLPSALTISPSAAPSGRRHPHRAAATSLAQFVSLGSKPHRGFPVSRIHCLLGSATSPRWIRAKACICQVMHHSLCDSPEETRNLVIGREIAV